MPIDLVWRAKDPYTDPDVPKEHYTGQHLVGAAWFTDIGTKKFWGNRGLSKHYLAYIANYRPPICIIVPTRQGGQATFLIDGHPTDKPNGAWKVEVDMKTLIPGRKPIITVSPSINCVGLYHGFLRRGTLGPDLG